MSEAREIELALLIADLSGYTALTETHGALRASDIVLRFGRMAEASLEPGVALLERVGDEVLVAGAEILAVVRTAFRLRGAVHCEPDFPTVRAAIHHGALVERDGRLFGAPLNLTARIAAGASGGQILCTGPIARASRPLAGVEARPIGEERFKNVVSPVALFELATATCAARDVAIDPVCRMQVTTGRASATASHLGRTFHFCSPECARAFAEAPEKFAGAVGDRTSGQKKGAT